MFVEFCVDGSAWHSYIHMMIQRICMFQNKTSSKEEEAKEKAKLFFLLQTEWNT